jgi:hypothetical protein
MTSATQSIITVEDGDWCERDNFLTEAKAREYAAFLSSKYPVTPYRIVHRIDIVVTTYGPATTSETTTEGRYVVEYIHV